MLVDYSDSESDTQEEQTRPSKKPRIASAISKSPPALPANFHSLYATSVRTATADDPSLHGGRSRQVPHTQGNWPTHVYLEWLPSTASFRLIQDIIASLQETETGHISINSFLKTDLDVQQPLHISLSAPLVLRTEQKDTFQTAIIQAVERCDAHEFRANPTALAWLPNLERSRYFLVLKLMRPEHDDLNKLLAACNTCAKALGMVALYDQLAYDEGVKAFSQTQDLDQDKSSAFHISIAWTLEKPSEAQQRMIDRNACDQLREIDIHFKCVKVKVGNVVTDVQLPKQ